MNASAYTTHMAQIEQAKNTARRLMYQKGDWRGVICWLDDASERLKACGRNFDAIRLDLAAARVEVLAMSEASRHGVPKKDLGNFAFSVTI